MRCTVLVPELFWPGDDAPDVCRNLGAHTLERLLARATARRHAPVDVEAWLCQAFEVERQRDWPVAPLTLALHGGDPGDHYWLRADPVHLQLQRDRVAVMPQTPPTREEADAMVAALNTHFADDGLQFLAPVPDQWYVRPGTAPRLATTTLSAAAGSDARDIAASGDDARAWRRIANEVQMVLYALPVNEARRTVGVPEINSVWFWGGGRKTRVPGRNFQAVWSDDSLAQALAVMSDAHGAPLPADGRSWLAAAGALPASSHHLVVYDACARPAAYRDAYGWREALMQFEVRWAEPLAAALKRGTLDALTLAITTPVATWRYELTRRALWKFWMSARPLAQYGRG